MIISQVLKDQIFFVIPAYNEGKVIQNVLKKLQKENYNNLIIINDGSTDNTSKKVEEILNKKGHLLEHVINRGQGAALKTGIDFALKQKLCKYIVTFDSDDQHDLNDLPQFIEALENNKCDIAIGSRFLKKESRQKVPLKKRIVLKGALFVTLFLSSIKLTDTHNGYRVMNKKAAKLIEITFDGFEHASEILDEISSKKIRYEEIPTFINYTQYSKQKGQKISNSIRILLRMVFKS